MILNNHMSDAIAEIEKALAHLSVLRLTRATNRFVLRQMRAKIWAARFAEIARKGLAS